MLRVKPLTYQIIHTASLVLLGSGWIVVGAMYGSSHPVHAAPAVEPTAPAYWAKTWNFTRVGTWAPETTDCQPIPSELPPGDSKGCMLTADTLGPFWMCGSWRVTMTGIHPNAGQAHFRAETSYRGSRGDTCKLTYFGSATAQ